MLQLIANENIGAVVSMIEPWEMHHTWIVDGAEWERLGVAFYWLPTKDYMYAPSVPELQRAVHFILRCVARVRAHIHCICTFSYLHSGKSVYIHCKAGRTRSATLAVCYLIEVGG